MTLTTRDITRKRTKVRKVCINDLRTSMVKNNEIMSSPLITINSNSSPSQAADIMIIIL